MLDVSCAMKTRHSGLLHIDRSPKPFKHLNHLTFLCASKQRDVQICTDTCFLTGRYDTTKSADVIVKNL